MKRNAILDNYSKSWKFIKESKDFIYFIVVLFFAFFLVGFFVPTPDYISEQIRKFIEELLNKTEGMSQFELIRFIFLNNLKSSFFAMVLGSGFGIFPVFTILFNGYIVGFISAISVSHFGIATLWKLFPHGIFELPAVFISAGMGLKIGSFIFQKRKADAFRHYFMNSLRVFLFVVIPLLIIAAIIEGSLIALGG